MNDRMQVVEDARVAVDAAPSDCFHETTVRITVEKYAGDWTREQIEAGLAGKPYEVQEGEPGNLLMTNGANILWTLLTGGAGTAYSNANAYIGVGDSTTAAAANQTDLQASTNKLRKAMDATYPQVSTNTCVFKSTFGSSEGNFAWQEWAVFNASSSGTMLQRKVESLGTKASGTTWAFTVTLSLA